MYAWNFPKYLCSAYVYIYIHSRAATCDREPGKVEKEVLAIPVVLLDTVTRTIVSEFQTVIVCVACDSSVADRFLR
jgi:hypothetical protein